MKTDELIALLARGTDRVGPGVLRRRLAIAFGGGALASLLLMATALDINPELARLALEPMFWVKLAYTGALAGIALALLAQLARPGARAGRAGAALAGPLLAIWLLAAYALGTAVPSQRASIVFGETWLACPFYIALLSLPLLAAMLWAVRGLAPTRLAFAGAAAGLVSGAAAASLYSLHCPELSAPFLGTWYPLGMAIPAGIGAALGPRLLRW